MILPSCMVTAGFLQGWIQGYQLCPMTQQGVEQRYSKLQVIKYPGEMSSSEASGAYLALSSQLKGQVYVHKRSPTPIQLSEFTLAG